MLRLAGGADPVQVSDDRVNEFLDSLTLEEIEAVITFNTWYRGHSWYVMTFPTWCDFGKTLVFDATTGFFFEWSTYCDSSNKHGRFRGDFHISFAGLNLVGDGLSGKLLKMDGSHYLDADLPIKRTIRVDTMGREMEYVSWGGTANGNGDR